MSKQADILISKNQVLQIYTVPLISNFTLVITRLKVALHVHMNLTSSLSEFAGSFPEPTSSFPELTRVFRAHH